ncbi:MAG: biotin/lipoyl-containing protein, partial [Kiritimatiellia bacterium]
GTFYAAPSPDSPAYVKIGQEVTPDSVLCIVEAMKVMNEIKAEIRGTVRAILVENAHAVQYGQPLFRIEKI